MYKRHSNWDEEKLDIHSDSSGYAGNSSGGSSTGYAGHSSKDSQQDYHKSEMYNATKPDEDKISGSYGSKELKEDDKKKEEDDKKKNIVDTVKQEEKYQKKEPQEEEEFKNIAKDFQQSNNEHEIMADQNNKNLKKKQNKSIEEAIEEAIKEEKEIVHAD